VKHEFIADESEEPGTRWHTCSFCRIRLWLSPRDVEYMARSESCTGSPEAELRHREWLMRMDRDPVVIPYPDDGPDYIP